MANPYQPGPPPMPPTGPFVQGPPPEPHGLTRGQRFGLGGCGIVVLGCVALVTASLVLGPDTVTKVKKVPGPTVTVTVAAAPAAEPSPSASAAGIPQLGGRSWRQAEQQVVRLRAVSAYTDVKLPKDHDGWRVCSQESKPSATGSTLLRLYLAESVCPAVPGTRLHPADPSPSPRRSQDGSTGGSSTDGGSTGGSGSTGGGSSSGGSSSGGSDTGGAGGGSRVVHPGAFCSPAGATGVTSRGTPMVCGPAADHRNRWHHA
ncbi:hypothetical protein [Streptomyces sp. NPDC089919]|uniref:hypothetical protein n=1 Tax=Streptomyces sp. NPDC089919 TaxID=3155188 RepID=UPI0034381C0E